MSALAGPLHAGALLLAAAGLAKLLRPGPTRVAMRRAGLPGQAVVARGIGAGEVVLAVAALAIGGPVAAAGVTAAYVGFAWFAARLRKRTAGAAPCGCFGGADAPVGRLHVAINLAVAAAAAVAVVAPAGPVTDALDETPGSGLPYLGLVALLTWMLYVSLTTLAATLAAARPTDATATTRSAVAR